MRTRIILRIIGHKCSPKKKKKGLHLKSAKEPHAAPEPRVADLWVRASASQSVDLGFIPLVESYLKTLKNGIYSFPAWRSAFVGGCGEQASKFACCVLGQGT